MATYTHKSILTWPTEFDRFGKGDIAFQEAGQNWIANALGADNPNRFAESITMAGNLVDPSLTMQNYRHNYLTDPMAGPVVVTRHWQSQQQAQDFVDFTKALCTQYNVPTPSAVIEPI